MLGLGKAMRGIDISNNLNLKVSGESDGLNSIPWPAKTTQLDSDRFQKICCPVSYKTEFYK